jgi:hypothetical protein
MQTKMIRRRAALALLVLLITAAAAACGHGGSDWQEVTTASGSYIAEFPGKPTTETQKVPDRDFTMQFTHFDVGGSSFAVAETALNGVAPYSLDDAVDGAIENMRSKEEAESGGTVTATELSRTPGDFEGVETRKFSSRIAGNGTQWEVSGLIFYRDDIMVTALVVFDGEADPESAQRFLSSLKTKP